MGRPLERLAEGFGGRFGVGGDDVDHRHQLLLRHLDPLLVGHRFEQQAGPQAPVGLVPEVFDEALLALPAHPKVVLEPDPLFPQPVRKPMKDLVHLGADQ